MDIRIVNVLKQIKADHGADIFLSRNRFNSLLKDYSKGEYKGEISLLTTALDQGIYHDLFDTPADYPKIKVSYMLKLKTEYFWTDEQATFAIEAWATVADIADNTESIVQHGENQASIGESKSLSVKKEEPERNRQGETGKDRKVGNGNIMREETGSGQKGMDKVNRQIMKPKPESPQKKRTNKQYLALAAVLVIGAAMAGYQFWRPVPSPPEVQKAPIVFPVPVPDNKNQQSTSAQQQNPVVAPTPVVPANSTATPKANVTPEPEHEFWLGSHNGYDADHINLDSDKPGTLGGDLGWNGNGSPLTADNGISDLGVVDWNSIDTVQQMNQPVSSVTPQVNHVYLVNTAGGNEAKVLIKSVGLQTLTGVYQLLN